MYGVFFSPFGCFFQKRGTAYGKKGGRNHVAIITHGEEFLDRVPVNLGSLLSLKERAPSIPSSELIDNLIARR